MIGTHIAIDLLYLKRINNLKNIYNEFIKTSRQITFYF